MSTIVTRAGKGSALTWTEGDANITNLNNDKLENVVQDTTPQLGGSLDVNGNAITSASNGNIRLEPNGSGNIALTPATGKIILGALDFPTGMGTNGQVLTTNGTSALSFTTISPGMTSFTAAGDSGSNQTVGDGNTLTISGGTGLSSVASATDVITLNLDNTAVTAGSYTYASITVDAQGRLTAASSGAAPSTITVSDDTTTNATRYVVFEDVTTGTSSSINVSSSKLTFNPSTGLLTAAFSGPIGSTAPSTGAFTTVTASTQFSGPHNGTVGATTPASGTFTAVTSNGVLIFKEPREAIFSLGTTGGTIAPNAANGSVQSITLNAALTINAFTNPAAGQSLTLIINGGTAYTAITSTMKFAGGIKTLTGTAGCIDILSVYYDGTTYFASLGKGFA